MFIQRSKKIAGDYISYASEKTVKNLGLADIILDERSTFAAVTDDSAVAWQF